MSPERDWTRIADQAIASAERVEGDLDTFIAGLAEIVRQIEDRRLQSEMRKARWEGAQR